MARLILNYKFFFLLLIVTPLRAQEPDSSSAIFQMREAELNFARESVMYGRNAAFARNMAERSVIFTDKWITNGGEYSKGLKPVPVVLKWEPEFMDIAESRDFGVSTGPWEAQEYRPNTAPLYTGYFLTVWKKSPGGKWQVILDGGSMTPQRTGNKHEFHFPPGSDRSAGNPPVKDISLTSQELLSREEQFLGLWILNPVPAVYKSFLSPHVRLQKNGYLPSSDPDTISLRTKQIVKSLRWSTTGSDAAGSGDMGVTYGIFESRSEKGGAKGHYVRIWRKLADNKWYIIIEMMNTD
jgi:ketosteroid isomerase-like protein